MAEIINLNRAKKARTRADRAAKAVENRVKFGRTKAEKATDRDERVRTVHLLDESKRER
jgi:hypothetical protein